MALETLGADVTAVEGGTGGRSVVDRLLEVQQRHEVLRTAVAVTQERVAYVREQLQLAQQSAERMGRLEQENRELRRRLTLAEQAAASSAGVSLSVCGLRRGRRTGRHARAPGRE